MNVTLKNYKSGKEAFEGLFCGENDMATVADAPIVFSGFAGRNFVVVASTVFSFCDSKIVARRDADIREPKDLRGKRIGTFFGTSNHYFLGLFLTNYGMSISDVDMVDLRACELPALLRQSKVDAASLWEPFAYEAQRLLGIQAVKLPAGNIMRTTFNLAVRKEYSEQSAGEIEKVLHAIRHANAFIKTHSAEVQEMMAERFNFSRGYLHDIWKDYHFMLFLDQSLLLGWEDIARWALENEIISSSTIPNYLRHVDVKGLSAVCPAAVTVIH